MQQEHKFFDQLNDQQREQIAKLAASTLSKIEALSVPATLAMEGANIEFNEEKADFEVTSKPSVWIHQNQSSSLVMIRQARRQIELATKRRLEEFISHVLEIIHLEPLEQTKIEDYLKRKLQNHNWLRKLTELKPKAVDKNSTSNRP